MDQNKQKEKKELLDLFYNLNFALFQGNQSGY